MGQNNPFDYGRELAPGRLVDRDEELGRIMRIVENRGRLFLIGPRRYGKTSLLREVEHRLANDENTVILRYDAEKYETLQLLAQALLTGAMRKLTTTLERAGLSVSKFFSRLRPEVSYNTIEQSISVSIVAAPSSEGSDMPLLMDVLDGIDRMAGESGRTVAVILDEFQQVVASGGITAERQLRSVVQTHHNVGYIFAGSKQRMLIDMIASASRPFWQSGDKMFLGPIPRDEFTRFLKKGFSSGDILINDDALGHILNLAEDVPHNVQLLAHACWDMARAKRHALKIELVDAALKRVVLENDPFYTQLWTSLTLTQKKALKAVIEERGVNLKSQRVAQKYNVAPSTMQKALKNLDDRNVIRDEESFGSIRVRLEDPFLAAWLRISQSQ
jgi:AAA+ ATPase superfamily predicted ATPase